MATLEEVDVGDGMPLEGCSKYVHLTGACDNLHQKARELINCFDYVPANARRRVFMVNSTAQGGGVAEMLPRMIQIFRDIGLESKWLVIAPRADHIPAFFEFTKRLHNLIHGHDGHEGDSSELKISQHEKATYRAVTEAGGNLLLEQVRDGDIVVLHDPQPLGMVKVLRESGIDLKIVFRCHIGLDTSTPATKAAWDFLRPFVLQTDGSVFSLPEYVPHFLKENDAHNHQTSIIPPGVDPLSHKNRELPPTRLMGVLCNAGLATPHHSVLTPAWLDKAQRLQFDGETFEENASDVGIPYRPIVLQVSRWDKLKGWGTLLEAFATLKLDRNVPNPHILDSESLNDKRHMRRIEIMRLVLAGPDPSSVADDPEGKAEFEKLCAAYHVLPTYVKADIALLTLPMVSRKHNALMVNALQRSATVVVQNSIREGFGLTVTEAMFKGVPILGTHACGIQKQVVDGEHGRLVSNSGDPIELARALNEMLRNKSERTTQGLQAQRRVLDEFTVFSQVGKWLTFLSELIDANTGK